MTDGAAARAADRHAQRGDRWCVRPDAWERQITGLAARGHSARRMAAALGISPFSVQDHLKAVFAKTGVRSRGELVAEVRTRHYALRSAAGAAPGPYGWYLDEHLAVL
ncbi:helix-turn-helix transcriptional regulator [Actinomadura sp. NPDC049753]|uniref:helix-turn-helix domain-containing protein n=1 Tax=Actinomadura sp. NPDC049753 TaxID=3154739 RepID=UPI003446367E